MLKVGRVGRDDLVVSVVLANDLVISRYPDWRIRVGAVCDTPEDALVDTRDSGIPTPAQQRPAQCSDIAGSESVVSPQTLSWVVDAAVFVLNSLRIIVCLWAGNGVGLEPQAGALRLPHDPHQWNLCQGVVRVAAANICMYAG